MVKEQDMVITIEALKSKVRKLKTNEKQIGKDTLQTKYAAAYSRLKEEINTLATTIINEKLTHISVPKATAAEDIVSFFNEYKKEFISNIYTAYDVDALLTSLENMKFDAMNRFHAFISFDEDEFDD